MSADRFRTANATASVQTPPFEPGARARRDRLAIATLVALIIAIGAYLLLPGQPVSSERAPDVLRVNVAEIQTDPQTPASMVTLPDTWAARGLPSAGIAHYRVAFHIETQPVALWAVRATAMSAHHEVRLNGQLVSGATLPVGTALQRNQPGAQRILLPPALLRAGTNRLDLVVSYGSSGGLSQLEIGPAESLEAAHRSDVFRRQTLPLVLNVAGLLASLAMLGLHWRHRSDALVGSMGLLALIGTLRNLLEFGVQTLPKLPVIDWGYLAMQHLALLTCIIGANHVARDTLRQWVRLTCVLSGGLLLVAAAAIPLDFFREMRALSLMAIFIPLVLATAMAAWRLNWATQRTRAAIVMALIYSLGAAVHDFLVRFGLVPMDHPEWTPINVPLGLTLVAWALLTRTARALRQSHDLNADLERRVEQRTQDLQQANAAKSRFLASASHDLRQPVATIGLLVGLMRDQGHDTALQRMIDRVDQAVAAMEDLLKGLLDLSRLESGSITPRRERVPLQRLFDAIATHEGETARRKGLRLRLRPTARSVSSDPVLLEQILRNLVSNALRYTEQGGVLVGCRQRGHSVWVEVHDSGRGIPADRQAHIFEEFVQLDNQARDRSRGMGLGLAIVSRSARLLDHRLRLTSTPGRGSCFAIELPLTATARPRSAAVEPADRPLQGYRVALIEDDPGVRQALNDRLLHWGGTVLSFEGQLALQAHVGDSTSRWTDLIVSDQRLPDGAGIEVIDWVRARQGATPAVLVTGDTDPGDIARMAERQVPVLYKPFRAEALLNCIRQAIVSPTGAHRP